MRNIFVINGSASENSSNQKIINNIIQLNKESFKYIIYNDLKYLPHFDPERSIINTPKEIVEFRKCIENADGILFCTPEYIFSIPSGLKNVLEWCVSTTVFSDKPIGIITASANGEKGHEELQLIMKTLMTNFNPETTLLISGVKGKVNTSGEINDEKTIIKLKEFSESFNELVKYNSTD
ncbi:NADPH-dependent FMN reductase [Sphingobacterium sp. PU5-4]|uniref:NADPH-dependent FMN reductase n=1 Tax=Sphingobacterium tenebrionis TaxID=3111775 RepID=A0ABU8IA01_9SPHI